MILFTEKNVSSVMMTAYAACTHPLLARASSPAVGLELFDRGWGGFIRAIGLVFGLVVRLRCRVQAVEIYFALPSGLWLFVAALRVTPSVQ